MAGQRPLDHVVERTRHHGRQRLGYVPRHPAEIGAWLHSDVSGDPGEGTRSRWAPSRTRRRLSGWWHDVLRRGAGSGGTCCARRHPDRQGGEVSSKAKLSLHHHDGRPLFVMTSGLRSVRDKVVLRLEDGLAARAEPLRRLHHVVTSFGDELKAVRAEDGPSLEAGGLRFNLHAIIGGQLADDDEPALFMVYPEGNWVTATDDSPSFIIGRTAYGKPILDRLLAPTHRCRTRWRWPTWRSMRRGPASLTWSSRSTSSCGSTVSCASSASRLLTSPRSTTLAFATTCRVGRVADGVVHGAVAAGGQRARASRWRVWRWCGWGWRGRGSGGCPLVIAWAVRRSKGSPARS